MIVNLAQGVQTFTSNAFLVTGERTVVVDTGANFDIVERIREYTDDIDAVVLTHTHPDHIGNLERVTETFDVAAWGFDPDQDSVDNAIADKERVLFGDDEYVALHTPGHKNDHLCFYSDSGVLFTGDLIFQNGSFGRTDLEEGDRATLVESIDRVNDVVGENVNEAHPGHGPSMVNNPRHDIELAGQAARMR